MRTVNEPAKWNSPDITMRPTGLLATALTLIMHSSTTEDVSFPEKDWHMSLVSPSRRLIKLRKPPALTPPIVSVLKGPPSFRLESLPIVQRAPKG
jgi:hypothetical protein